MMNKVEFNERINNIHPSNKLKYDTLEKMKKSNSQNRNFEKYLAACAMFLIICTFFKMYDDSEIYENSVIDIGSKINANSQLPRFSSMQELVDAIPKRNYSGYNYKSMDKEEVVADLAVESATNSTSRDDFSKTNVQVENVDEADIIKTDGNYIYYVANDVVYIVMAESLELESKIEQNTGKNTRNYISNIFINGNHLVTLGNEYINDVESKRKQNSDDNIYFDVAYVDSSECTKAVVYDISDRSNPVIKREVKLDGYYSNARMIGNSVYLISSKSVFYNDGMKEEEILPKYVDTAVSEEKRIVQYNEIAYFKNPQNSNFTLVAGFDITKNDPINLESFYGASNLVYASEKNLYIFQPEYDNSYYLCKNMIYKFSLDSSKVVLKCQGEVDGNINNQFSIDEYDGNLRIATTLYEDGENEKNRLYVLDENLQKIGEISSFADGERIYAVRFMGKIGYVVTFEQIDPLFVIDLSEPQNPVIKGELEIPGYSSYLHLYDETHVIGIGHNVKSNGYGGVTNDSIKMSMFDVSDLENPKEMFNVNVSDSYAYTDLEYNHKVLFYSKDKNLIGFPYTTYYKKGKRTFKVFDIDLEQNEFTEHGKIEDNITDYANIIQRAIYIGNTLYTVSYNKIVAYDLNTFEGIGEVSLE